MFAALGMIAVTGLVLFGLMALGFGLSLWPRRGVVNTDP